MIRAGCRPDDRSMDNEATLGHTVAYRRSRLGVRLRSSREPVVCRSSCERILCLVIRTSASHLSKDRFLFSGGPLRVFPHFGAIGSSIDPSLA